MTTSFTNSASASSMLSKVSNSLKLLGKGQDYIYKCKVTGISGVFDFILLFDGHGDNSCINAIRELNLEEIANEENPCKTLFEIINANPKVNLHSGSTMCYAKIFETYVETDFMGDSSIFVFCDGILKYSNMSQHHNINNEDEAARLYGKGRSINSTSYRIDGDNIFTIKSNYFKWQIKNGETVQLAPTQCLGHHGITGIKSCKRIVEIKPGENVKVMMMSDGVTDMLNKSEIEELWKLSSDEINERAEARWKKEWLFEYEGDIITTSFPYDGYDDCSVIIYESSKSDEKEIKEETILIGESILDGYYEMSCIEKNCSYLTLPKECFA